MVVKRENVVEAELVRRVEACGGMAEKVTNGVNGLHFTVNDPDSMAAAIERAASEPGLWEHLREGIPDILTVDDHIVNLTRMYGELLERRAEPVPELAE